jgi:hypothetical protein
VPQLKHIPKHQPQLSILSNQRTEEVLDAAIIHLALLFSSCLVLGELRLSFGCLFFFSLAVSILCTLLLLLYKNCSVIFPLFHLLKKKTMIASRLATA